MPDSQEEKGNWKKENGKKSPQALGLGLCERMRFAIIFVRCGPSYLNTCNESSHTYAQFDNLSNTPATRTPEASSTTRYRPPGLTLARLSIYDDASACTSRNSPYEKI